MEENVKKALSAISWDDSGSNVYFTFKYQNTEVNAGLEMKEPHNYAGFDTQQLSRIVQEMPQWDRQARAILQTENPDEDVGELLLDDLQIHADGSFLLGYFAEDNPEVGKVYLYIAFSSDFVADDTDVMYEVY